MFSKLRSKNGDSFKLGNTLYDQKKYGEAERLFRQVADDREKKLSNDHKDTLYSRYWLGRTLHKQKKYGEAERVLRQAVDGQEKKLGSNHKDTLNSKYWLGLTLYGQEKYGEAERVLRQVTDGEEKKKLGSDHKNTLYSKYWLGLTLSKQKKHGEAERVLQQVADGQGERLGSEHKDTLLSKHWLGLTLYDQKKYGEAERVLRQAVDGQERTLSSDHKNTLASKYWLGLTLYDQKKYDEAERVLHQAADGQEKKLGSDHEEPLYSKHWLGKTLSKLEKHGEAERLFQQATDGQEKKLGSEHKDTLLSKYWLGLTLYDQKKYGEAERVLRQAVDGQEKKLGSDHENTLATARLLQDLHLNLSSFSLTSPTTRSTPADRLTSFFQDGKHDRELYTDSDIAEISLLLKRSSPQWSRVPRTYIVLRIIGQLNLLDDLINIGFSDYWFPVTERSLPHCLRPSVRAAFSDAQRLVLTKSIGLEKVDKGQHCHFRQGESLPLEPKGVLGNGGFGQVDRVMSLISFKEYARKRVLKSAAFRGRRLEDMKQFIAEIQVLKRLKHQHIVEFIGSYTDPKYIGLIMSPIAEMDLSVYLKRANDSNHPELRTFFGCLATALEFLHGQKVRHKDIKPGNILINGGKVLFTDFGLSLDFTDASGSTTVSMVNGMTPRYCAPEVAEYQPRNTASDIWSLGVVFMEMIVVLKSRTTQHMDDFFRQRGSQQAFIRTNPTALEEFIAELEVVGDLFDNRAFSWIQQMLSTEQQLRPTASSLAASITAMSHEGEGMGFCGICCISSEEEFSDWMDD